MYCPYCGKTARLRATSGHIFKRDYGPIWECECGARCGCHPGTTRPLGTLADGETRIARSTCHRFFDRLWKNDDPHFRDRRRAYEWLRKKMRMTENECHIGNFTADECRRAIEHCRMVWQHKLTKGMPDGEG